MLEFRPFGREHYAEYATWFSDRELNSRLGPLDDAWLAATLEDENYETWAVFRKDAFVGVLEADIDPNQQLALIAGIATRPDLRRQGIAVASLRWLLACHHQRCIYSHTAYIALDNLAARRCLTRLHFTLSEEKPDEQGFLRFVYEFAPEVPR